MPQETQLIRMERDKVAVLNCEVKLSNSRRVSAEEAIRAIPSMST